MWVGTRTLNGIKDPNRVCDRTPENQKQNWWNQQTIQEKHWKYSEVSDRQINMNQNQNQNQQD